MPLRNNPLKQEDCDALNCVLQSTPDSLELAKVCEECGLDVSDLRGSIQAQHDMATKMKAAFFPYEP